MLQPNITSDLDMLASQGIIDFDAAAFLTGTQPRYVGNSYNRLLPSSQIPINNGQFNQPNNDEYMNTQNTQPKSGNPAWKKILFGGIVLALGVFGVSRLKAVKKFFQTNKVAVPQGVSDFWTNTKQKSTDGWKYVSTKCSDGWSWLKGKVFTTKTTP